jgi:hypothetical protein
MKKDFSKIAINTSLFKGHSQWLYFYLKTERLAHVVLLLQQRSSAPSLLFDTMAERAAALPAQAVGVALGEFGERVFVADIFSLLTQLRLLVTKEEVGSENASILIEEYENIIERLAMTGRAKSPMFSSEQLAVSVPELAENQLLLPSHLSALDVSIKDIHKGHYKSQKLRTEDREVASQASGDRTFKILEIIRQNKGISIKGISAIVRDCSEKTIQRELGTLIDQGLVIREGERRWSIYRASPISTPTP